MTDRQSHLDRYIERLLVLVNDPSPFALSHTDQFDAHLVMLTRLAYARLMLALAVRQEAASRSTRKDA